MMTAITRREGRPTREQIIQAIGQQDALSIEEQIIAKECEGEPMSWEE